MLFLMRVLVWLLQYRCDGHATIFKFKQNFSFTCIDVYRFAIVSFLSTADKFYFLCMLISEKDKMNND